MLIQSVETIRSILVLLAAPTRQFARRTTFMARIIKKPCAAAARKPLGRRAAMPILT